MKKHTYPLLILLFLFLPAGFSGYQDKDFELSKNLDIYHSLMRELNLFYVDEIQPSRLITQSMHAMLASLDPYTVYIPESSMEDLELMTTGQYGGVGALIGQMDGQIVITNPYEGFPAQQAGLRAGDIIQQVDGRKISDLNSSEVSELMKGPVGTAVELVVSRPFHNQDIQVRLTREKIRINNVPHYELMDDSTGYIRLGGFTQGAAQEVAAAFQELKGQGMEKLILDLRSNPGGLLIEAVDLMNLFVPQNQEIVSTRGKVERWNTTYYTRRQPVDTLIPVAVLINSQSASASEIVAGAMQDLDRGIVLGQRSFGKGLVQTTRDLSYNTKLKLTTAKYYIPSGRCIQALDYSHRREDGSVGQVPDSLISEFKTTRGRIVRDGGGITPDFTLEARMLSKMSTALVYQNKIFDFATQIRNTREHVPDPQTFQLTDADLGTFVTQLRRDSFQYETGSAVKLKELKDMMSREGYDDLAKAEAERLENLLRSDLDRDIRMIEDEVKTLLAEEILSRYHFEKGRISHILKDDPVVLKARHVLHDAAFYRQTLGIQMP